MKSHLVIQFNFEYYYLPKWLAQVLDKLRKNLVDAKVAGYDIVEKMVNIFIDANNPFDTCEAVKEILEEDLLGDFKVLYRYVNTVNLICLYPKEFDIDGKTGKEYLIKNDFHVHSVWLENETDELIYPVYNIGDLPDYVDERGFLIRSTFTIQTEIEFKGFIGGRNYFCCIAIFWRNEVFYFNPGLLDHCFENLEKINLILDKKITPEEFSPLKFQTTAEVEGFNNFCGEFNIF